MTVRPPPARRPASDGVTAEQADELARDALDRDYAARHPAPGPGELVDPPRQAALRSAGQ